jgi:hypothetical protein
MDAKITFDGLAAMFEEKIVELQEEPEFQWSKEKIKYAMDADGAPALKLAIGNVPLDYDLWKGLRNPAVVGAYPAGLREIWEFYANRRKENIDVSGRQTIFQIPRSFDFALKNYRRAAVVSVMLPFSQQIIGDYVQLFTKKGKGSSHLFSRMYNDVNLMLDKATSRVAIDLVNDSNSVIAMNNETVKNVSEEAIPTTHQGASHGPSKGGNYPQKSVAALTGLGQFGIARIIFRDELENGKIQRFSGPIRSIVIFDKEEPVTDGSNGIMYPTDSWREFLFKLFDFTNTDAGVNRYRFCTYIPYGDKGCTKCLSCCPSGAQANSAPTQSGKYVEQISKQQHRFWEGKLQFDYGRCCEERGQMTTLFPEWSCARCVSSCVAQGNRRTAAAKDFYEKMRQLTTN